MRIKLWSPTFWATCALNSFRVLGRDSGIPQKATDWLLDKASPFLARLSGQRPAPTESINDADAMAELDALYGQYEVLWYSNQNFASEVEGG